MPMVTLRPALLSFVSTLALIATPVWAQEAPPVSDPAAGQRPPVIIMGPPIAPDETPAIAPSGEPTTPPVARPAPKVIVAPIVAPIPAVWSPIPVDDADRSAYGLFLAGRYLVGRSSIDDGDGASGASYLLEAEALTPEQPLVRDQALTAALITGDLEAVGRLSAAAPDVSPVIGGAARLVAAVQTFVRGDARAANTVLKSNPIPAPNSRAAILVQPWIAAAARDWNRALIAPAPSSTDLYSQILRLQRAQLLEIHRQYDDADLTYKLLTADPKAHLPFRLNYGAFLERRGRRDDAIALYDASLSAGVTDAPTRLARERAAAGGRAPTLLTLREGAAEALKTGATLAAADGANEFAAVYLRLALSVQPNDEYRLLLGATLVQAKLEANARDVFGQVSMADPDVYAAARTQIGISLTRQDRDDLALAEYQKAAAVSPSNPGIAYFLAAQLIKMKREDEALAILNGPLLNTAQQQPDIRFMRGAAYETLGRIPEAETELTAALAAQPNEPSYLNYLGYLWVDSGTKVAEGAALIERAHAAQPEDGNIQDSLGWSQFRRGEYQSAVDTLEQAVAKEPANAEINDHLGDAYWQVGRKREAGWQWNRVLTLAPDAERRAGIEKKLADGLTPPTPVSAVSTR